MGPTSCVTAIRKRSGSFRIEPAKRCNRQENGTRRGATPVYGNLRDKGGAISRFKAVWGHSRSSPSAHRVWRGLLIRCYDCEGGGFYRMEVVRYWRVQLLLGAFVSPASAQLISPTPQCQTHPPAVSPPGRPMRFPSPSLKFKNSRLTVIFLQLPLLVAEEMPGRS
jgi:hypothetical protein